MKLSPVKPCRRCRWGFAAILLSVASIAWGSETISNSSGTDFTTGNIDLSYGQESYTSPLIQISNTGALVRLEGINRLAGSVRRLGLSGTVGHQDPSGLSVHLSGSIQEKSSGNAPDLAFRLLALDPMVSVGLFGGSLSLGTSLQKIDIAGRPFRDRKVAHSDWTTGTRDGGYVSYVLEYGVSRHAEDYDMLDSQTAQVLVRRQFIKPIPGTDEIAIELGASRERNTRGFANFSNQLFYSRTSVEADLGQFRVSLSWMHQRTRFDEADLPRISARRDRFDLFEFVASYPVTASFSVRAELLKGRNAANSDIYQSQIRGAMIGARLSF